MKLSLIFLSGSLLATSGCATLSKLAPLTKPVIVDAPQAQLPAEFPRVRALNIRTVANDNVLQALLEGVPESPEVAIAEGRLSEAKFRATAARAGLLPNVTSTTTVSGNGANSVAGRVSASLGASVQVPIDLFGANRSRVDAARIRAEEAVYTKERTLSQTRATLSQLYVLFRTAQTQIQVTKANQASAEDSLSLALARQRAGLETGLAVAQATSNRDAIAARLPAFQQAEIAARLGIEALLGRLPDTLGPQLASVQAIPRFDLTGSTIAPEQWIRTRADLMAAQRRLEASGLEAGAAKRDRYPSLTLTSLLNQSEASRGPTGLAGSVSANLLSTLFDFGRLEALAKAAGAVAQVQSDLYKQAVFNALSDVESRASGVERGVAAITANDANVASAQDQARLARVRYTSGLSGFLDVLTAQSAVYEAQSAQVRAVSDTALTEVDLALALGF
jgi:outer membrane protein, multidrug efflux system